MPISSWQAISDITAEIVRLSPKRVLDLGIGFGMYGAICRNYLDAMHGRCAPKDWQVCIEGVEVHRDYRNACWWAYNRVWKDDFEPVMWEGYDLVLMIDSLEHLEPAVGRAFLEGLVARNKQVIVSVPNGPMEQGAAHGNEYERHRWTFNGTEEFEAYKFKLIHQSLCTVVSIEGNG